MSIWGLLALIAIILGIYCIFVGSIIVGIILVIVGLFVGGGGFGVYGSRW